MKISWRNYWRNISYVGGKIGLCENCIYVRECLAEGYYINSGRQGLEMHWQKWSDMYQLSVSEVTSKEVRTLLPFHSRPVKLASGREPKRKEGDVTSRLKRIKQSELYESTWPRERTRTVLFTYVFQNNRIYLIYFHLFMYFIRIHFEFQFDRSYVKIYQNLI